MKPEPEELPVIFRAERSGDFKGDVTAVFPTLPADYAGQQLTIYAHVGQHGGGCFAWYYSTRAAKPHEYAYLLDELRAIYERSLAPGDPVYRLKVYQRMTPQHRRAFEAEAKRYRAELRQDPSGAPWTPAEQQAGTFCHAD